ncbi:hypothetical protein RFI_16509 [Reticulomyxa filosa]|uniref:Uncharacterized protein n=1 Tax=Reticulomyxa filosa TaxID=46433 RepID=X6N468_RETFI|nr:hypothetical protein RFI_16509 [Reticulomyxa filosa]|eukprot:ETO20708.1 hypothetical protein RFI_16509 [Reticulomyxa filosa]
MKEKVIMYDIFFEYLIRYPFYWSFFHSNLMNPLIYIKTLKKAMLLYFLTFDYVPISSNLKLLEKNLASIINNMANRTTTQKLPERQTEQSKHIIASTLFQSLKELPAPLSHSQCVLHKHEILICGGSWNKNCYSYHTLKNEYKFICEYPSNVSLVGHCIVKLLDNNKDSDEITLLSFGGKYKHTLTMKYVSVWDNNDSDDNEVSKLKKLNKYNKWVPFLDNKNCPIYIGRDKDDYEGVRAVIGGNNNNLLFITYQRKNISVFNLNIFKFIKHNTLPTDDLICYHCFIAKPEMMKINKKNFEMILFCRSTGLSIVYDEETNTFQFHQLSVCTDIARFNRYAYVYTNNFILFFGGCNDSLFNHVISKSVHKYSIRDNKWIPFKHTLPIPLSNCIGILNDYNTDIHIIGGNNENILVSTHMKTIVNSLMNKSQPAKDKINFVIQHWIRIEKIKLGWINDFEEIIIKYVKNFKLSTVFQAHDSKVNSVTFSADGRKIVSASDDHSVRVWDAESGKQLKNFRGHTNKVFAARFSPDGNTVVSCSENGTIRLWDVDKGTEIMKFKRDLDKIYDVNFSPDGKYIVSGLQDSTVRLWNLHSGMEMLLIGHSEDVLSTQFSPDGKMIASSSNDKIINLWNVESGEISKQLRGHSDRVTRATFSPDGLFIASCSLDNIARIWDIKTGKSKMLKGYLSKINDLKYFPDGQKIVSCSNGKKIGLWNAKSGKKMQEKINFKKFPNILSVIQQKYILLIKKTH